MGGAEIGMAALQRFFEQATHDPGIDAGHIALFMALFSSWQKQLFVSPIRITSKAMMSDAKISSSATYFKKLKYLCEAGYILYQPSHHGPNGCRIDFAVV